MRAPNPDNANGAFTWRVHPATEHLGRLCAGVALIIAFAAAAGLAAGSYLWSIFALIVLMIALNRFFLPSRFELDDEGITARYPFRTRRMKWSQLRRFAHDDEGGVLSPRRRPSRLNAFAGLHVHFGTAGETAIEAIRTRLDRAVGAGASAAAGFRREGCA